MKIKVSDYIAQYLAEKSITYVFSVVGGGAMHLNDSFGNNKNLTCIYCHHEQACAIAAEGYYRVNNSPAVVCVTTGPGGTNAITGVLGSWLDGLPMIVISGQVRYETCARSTGLPLRAMGDQEFDITKAISSMTKYCEMIIDKTKIKYALDKAFFYALNGRPGPVWLDIPLDVQGAIIETDDLESFEGVKENNTVTDETVDRIIDLINRSKRPVINAGSAIRTSNAKPIFDILVKRLGIPVVTGWNSIDLIATDNPYYVGRAGIMGDRAGNFAIQNSDLILSLGSRLSIRQVGYNFESWAREAFVIDVDIDESELKKPTIHVDLPICCDVKTVIEKLNSKLKNMLIESKEEWVLQCLKWKRNYPVTQKKHYDSKQVNVYAFIDTLSKNLSSDSLTVVGNGSACVVGSQSYVIKEKSKFIINSAVASMGYDLPAAVGACFANGKKDVVCVTGDGSIQMNLQELQTIIHHKLPIKIFIINNGGYHSIRQTQNNLFAGRLVGIGNDSSDLSFPSMEKIAFAYGFPYFKITETKDLDSKIKQVLSSEGNSITEVFVTIEQNFEPKSSSKIGDDGKIYSPPIEDMFPFLPPEELKDNMIIPLWEK